MVVAAVLVLALDVELGAAMDAFCDVLRGLDLATGVVPDDGHGADNAAPALDAGLDNVDDLDDSDAANAMAVMLAALRWFDPPTQ